MRDILFRGKAIGGLNAGRWIYGYYVKDFWTPSSVGHGIIPADRDIGGYCEVYPDTVGQYTGLTDKNGKKIFEGDIVDCWSEGVNAQGTVQQRRDGLWIIYPSWQKNIMWGLCPDEYSNTTVEVIGNIHDNPELIGGADNAR